MKVKIGEQWRVTIRRIEKKLGEKWTGFINQNDQLIKRIFEAERAREPVYEILKKYADLLFSWQDDEAEKLIKETRFEEIDRETASKLNPLLEEAAQKMEKAGINWREI